MINLTGNQTNGTIGFGEAAAALRGGLVVVGGGAFATGDDIFMVDDFPSTGTGNRTKGTAAGTRERLSTSSSSTSAEPFDVYAICAAASATDTSAFAAANEMRDSAPAPRVRQGRNDAVEKRRDRIAVGGLLGGGCMVGSHVSEDEHDPRLLLEGNRQPAHRRSLHEGRAGRPGRRRRPAHEGGGRPAGGFSGAAGAQGATAAAGSGGAREPQGRRGQRGRDRVARRPDGPDRAHGRQGSRPRDITGEQGSTHRPGRRYRADGAAPA